MWWLWLIVAYLLLRTIGLGAWSLWRWPRRRLWRRWWWRLVNIQLGLVILLTVIITSNYQPILIFGVVGNWLFYGIFAGVGVFLVALGWIHG